MATANRQIILKTRPKGPVSADNFEIRTQPVPDLQDGQTLVRTLFLSIDPTIRSWMERDTYLPAIAIGSVIRSLGAGVVVASRSSKVCAGDRVFGVVDWQQFAVIGDSDLMISIPSDIDLRDALSVFGVTGMTAYFGLNDIGRPRPGETVVVSGAAGATGSIVGQLAKAHGCRVVGIAGSAAKCAWLTDELGFDAAIDYKTDHVRERLAETCPGGIDIFFDNVGGEILNAALERLALGGRVVACGAISQYNDPERGYGPANYVNLISRRGRMEGFIILDYVDRFSEGFNALARLVATGKLKHQVTVVDGLDHAPSALCRLFTGDHEGKLLVRVGDG